MRKLAFVLLAGVMLMGAGCPDKDRDWLAEENLPTISQTLREACQGVIDIPSQDLTKRQILHLWAVDRYRLGICAKRHAGLARAIDILEKHYSR